MVRGPEQVFEFANPLQYELFANDELLGKTVLQVVPEAAEQGFVALLGRLPQTGEPFWGR